MVLIRVGGATSPPIDSSNTAEARLPSRPQFRFLESEIGAGPPSGCERPRKGTTMNSKPTLLALLMAGVCAFAIASFFFLQARNTTPTLPAVLPATAQAAGVVRIGTYDSRAIAVAYTNSDHFDRAQLAQKMKELNEAKAAGDEKRAEELEGWGARQQQLAHFRAFGRYPVDELLKEIDEGVAQLAAEKDLDAIVWFADYHSDGVELVDVTMDLVRLFEPTDKGLMWAEQVGSKEPLSFDELIQLDPRN